MQPDKKPSYNQYHDYDSAESASVRLSSTLPRTFANITSITNIRNVTTGPSKSPTGCHEDTKIKLEPNFDSNSNPNDLRVFDPSHQQSKFCPHCHSSLDPCNTCNDLQAELRLLRVQNLSFRKSLHQWQQVCQQQKDRVDSLQKQLYDAKMEEFEIKKKYAKAGENVHKLKQVIAQLASHLKGIPPRHEDVNFAPIRPIQFALQLSPHARECNHIGGRDLPYRTQKLQDLLDAVRGDSYAPGEWMLDKDEINSTLDEKVICAISDYLYVNGEQNSFPCLCIAHGSRRKRGRPKLKQKSARVKKKTKYSARVHAARESSLEASVEDSDSSSSLLEDLRQKYDIVDQKDCLKKFKINANHRIPALVGQYGLRARRWMPEATVLGQYVGVEYLENEYINVYSDTTHSFWNDLFAFDINLRVPFDVVQSLENPCQTSQSSQSCVNIDVASAANNNNNYNNYNKDMDAMEHCDQRGEMNQYHGMDRKCNQWHGNRMNVVENKIVNFDGGSTGMEAINANYGNERKCAESGSCSGSDSENDIILPVVDTQIAGIKKDDIVLGEEVAGDESKCNALESVVNDASYGNSGMARNEQEIGAKMELVEEQKQDSLVRQNTEMHVKKDAQEEWKNDTSEIETESGSESGSESSKNGKIVLRHNVVEGYKMNEAGDRIYKCVIDGYGLKKKSLLIYINDAREDINMSELSREDEKFMNAKFVTVVVNGYPSIFCVTVRDVEKGEEINAMYGEAFAESIFKLNRFKEIHAKRVKALNQAVAGIIDTNVN